MSWLSNERMGMLMRQISVLLVSFLLLACDSTIFDVSGETSSNVHINKYFGISLKLPENWHVIEKSQSEKIQENGAESLSDGNILKEFRLRVALMKTLNLFISTKNGEFGEGVSFSPSFSVLAEQNQGFIFKRKSSQYLKLLKEGLLGGKVPYTFTKSISTQKLSNLRFDVLSAVIDGEGYLRVNQDYYVTNIKDYSLVFILTYVDEEDRKTMVSSLESMKRLVK